LVAALPGMIGSLCVYFLPESPKFLMARGKNDEALQVFQHIFNVNTGKDASEYPVSLIFIFLVMFLLSIYVVMNALVS
jgi:hypothetical protein